MRNEPSFIYGAIAPGRMAVKIGSTVKIHYKGTFSDGVVFDDSHQREPLQFTVGTGKVIPGFERNVIGMEQGQQKSFTIEAKDGYGEHRPEMVVTVPRDKFPSDMDFQKGAMLSFKKDSMQFNATVAGVEGNNIQLDMNHPLAGKSLNFTIELIGVE